MKRGRGGLERNAAMGGRVENKRQGALNARNRDEVGPVGNRSLQQVVEEDTGLKQYEGSLEAWGEAPLGGRQNSDSVITSIGYRAGPGWCPSSAG